MTRIPYVRREELGPEGQRLWDSIVNGRGDLVVTADGGLAGPFNAFVTAPGAGRRMSSLGATLRFDTSIERRLSEIAIITTGARWQAEFEWWAHAPMAREHGVADAVVDAIGRGDDPPFEADDERAVYTVARQLSHSGRLDQETYDAAHRFLGDTGMVELVSLCGYYTLVSFLLNAFAVPLPPDATPMWAEANPRPHPGAEGTGAYNTREESIDLELSPTLCDGNSPGAARPGRRRARRRAD